MSVKHARGQSLCTEAGNTSSERGRNQVRGHGVTMVTPALFPKKVNEDGYKAHLQLP